MKPITATAATSITKAASKQTYYTIRFLADRERVDDAYRAYGYFRWVDDLLDAESGSGPARMAFLERQRSVANGGEQCKSFRGGHGGPSFRAIPLILVVFS